MNNETGHTDLQSHFPTGTEGLSETIPPRSSVNSLLSDNSAVCLNLNREALIQQIIHRNEAFVSRQGFLFTHTPAESTGRSPGDTYIVKDPNNEKLIAWDSANNHPLEREIFEGLWQDALSELEQRSQIYVTERVIGAESKFALPVKTITDNALTALFTLNMFRPIPHNIKNSILADEPFTLLVLPGCMIDTKRYQGRLRRLADGKTSQMAIIMDFKNRLGLVYGSSYGGSVKKLMFTAMNYYLPLVDVLPLHCSSNENKNRELALFLGLSGTGKTSLSTNPDRALLGDDEHGWSDRGIANFENGCYAKLIDLNPVKEPEIFNAVFHEDRPTRHGAIVENAMIFSDGCFNLSDDRLTPNSRASYPLSFLSNYKQSSVGPHPKTIIFLTADANGVLPPISRLGRDQALLWFLMGYTSKLAGTEAGVINPVSIFSRFFGEPFMPLLPEMYLDLLSRKLNEHQTATFLINTGWVGGPFGVGHRIDIDLTRRMVNAALDGKLEDVDYAGDSLFHLQVPKTCPGIPHDLLIPERIWSDSLLYEKRARSLAEEFSRHFDKTYGKSQISERIMRQCPGK